MSGEKKGLRLGPVPRNAKVKITISLALSLKELLDRYAALHSQLHGEQVDAARLIPYMLAAFIERDRGFRANRTAISGASKAPEAVK